MKKAKEILEWRIQRGDGTLVPTVFSTRQMARDDILSTAYKYRVRKTAVRIIPEKKS